MNTITIEPNLYQGAELYARMHNISVKDIVEKYLRHILIKETDKESANLLKPVSELHPQIQTLVGIARRNGDFEVKDINGRDIKQEYLEERYSK